MLLLKRIARYSLSLDMLEEERQVSPRLLASRRGQLPNLEMGVGCSSLAAALVGLVNCHSILASHLEAPLVGLEHAWRHDVFYTCR